MMVIGKRSSIRKLIQRGGDDGVVHGEEEWLRGKGEGRIARVGRWWRGFTGGDTVRRRGIESGNVGVVLVD